MRELLTLWLVKWNTVRIRTQLGIYGQIYPFSSGEGVYLTVYPELSPNTDTNLLPLDGAAQNGLELKVSRQAPIQLFMDQNFALLQWLLDRQLILNHIDLGYISQNILCPSICRSLPFPGQVCMTTFVFNGPCFFCSNNNYWPKHLLSCQVGADGSSRRPVRHGGLWLFLTTPQTKLTVRTKNHPPREKPIS